MNNVNNKLMVASFKNISGGIFKTICFDSNVIFNEEMIPDDAIAYYLYSKKEDGKFSNDTICQIGMPLGDAINKNKENLKLLAFLKVTTKECIYSCIDGKEQLFPMEDNMTLVNNYDELVDSFRNDLEKSKTVGKQYTKKM